MIFSHDKRSRRLGLTLTELLVVISIVIVLVGALIPLVRPMVRGQRVREASRQINVFFTSAQAKAVASGRPMGVWLERAAHEPGDPPNLWYTCHKMYLAEQPDPYTGDVFDARVVIRPTGGPNWAAYYQYPEDPTVQPPCCPTVMPARQAGIPLVGIGDLIRFEGRDPNYIVTGVDESKITFRVDNPESLMAIKRHFHVLMPQDMAARASFQPGVRFEVFRRPVKAVGTPIELPRNTAIDLSLSGYGSPFNSPLIASYNQLIPGTVPPASGYETRFREVSPEYDVVIMFNAQGSVDRVYYLSHEPEPPLGLPEHLPYWEIPQGTIHLFASRDDQIGRDTFGNLNVNNDPISNVVGPLGLSNLRDSDNIWLSISTQTGRIISVPNADAFIDPLTNQQTVIFPFNGDARMYLENARRLALSGQSMGGR